MNFTEKIIELWKFLKGSLHYRFAILICYLGASFMFPQLWEYIFYYVIEIFKSTINPDLKLYEIGDEPIGILEYILGVSLIISGLIIFIYFHKKHFKDNVNLTSILNSWQNVHDLSNNRELFNVDNVIKAVCALNETGSLLKNAEDKVITTFNDLRGEDFIILYDKIIKNNYVYQEKAFRDDLTEDSQTFYNQLKSMNNE